MISLPKHRNDIHRNRKVFKCLTKFWIISTHVVKIWDHLNENWSNYEITKLYQIFHNTLYISNDIKNFEAPYVCIYINIVILSGFEFEFCSRFSNTGARAPKTAVVSMLLYGCTTWTLTKRIEKKRDGNCTRMLRAILNKSWKQHPTKQQLYGHQLPISKNVQIRRTGLVGHWWRSKDELISDIFLMDPFTWMWWCWPTNKNLSTVALYGHGI